MEVFSKKGNLKGKQISISESLTKLRLMKEARNKYTFVVWMLDGKIIFKDDNKVKVYFDEFTDSKLCWFTLMAKEIALGSISWIFVLGFYMGFFYEYCIKHLFLIFLSRIFL